MNPNPRVVLAVALVGIGAGLLAVPAAADCPEFVGSVATPDAQDVAMSAGSACLANGESLETKTMDLPPLSNNQITRVFRGHAPIPAGYVDIWTSAPGGTIYCYGSVLDNLTPDPTTVLPQ